MDLFLARTQTAGTTASVIRANLMATLACGIVVGANLVQYKQAYRRAGRTP